MWKKYSLARGYLHYWLHAVNEHSLHAPFVYRLYCDIIKHDLYHSSFAPLEALRQSFLRNRASVPIKNLGAPSLVSSHPQRTVRSLARHSLSSPKFSRLLYRLAVDQSSDYIVELGTSLGINALYLSLARPSAQIYTLEGVDSVADLAEPMFQHPPHTNVRLIRGGIDQTLPGLLAQLPRVDLAYVDANHHYEPTVRYFEQLLTKIYEDSIIIIDDIYWSDEMQRAWQHIKQHPAVSLSLDLFDAGIVFFLPLEVRQTYTLMF